MTGEPTHKFFGVPLSDWIEQIPNELEVDAVGLWQIVPVGRDDFNLSGDALRGFVTRSIEVLLNKGAVPVRPSPQKGVFWIPEPSYVGKEPVQVAQSIAEEWERSGKDPDHDGLWFARLDRNSQSEGCNPPVNIPPDVPHKS